MKRAWLVWMWLAPACGGSSDKSEPTSDAPDPSETESVTDDSGDGDPADGTDPAGLVLEPGVNELTIDQVVEGETVQRSYLVHVPSDYDGSTSESTPLLFAFHGADGEGSDFLTPLEPAIEGHAFIGVYPDGIANSWNVEREESTADDVAFAASILDALDGTAGIDIERPVGVGFSNGSGLLLKIAMETDLFVAIVPQSSQLMVDAQPPASAARVSVMQFHGTDDPICPYDGGTGILGYNYLPAEESAAVWAAHNGCDETAIETAIDPHVRMEWPNCADDRRVIHYRLNGVEHSVPPDVDGPTTARIVEFLLEARQ